MATPLSQTRIKDLQPFVDGGVGMPDYEELLLAVDHADLSRPLKVNILATPASSTGAIGKLTGLPSRTVEETFPSAFPTIPVIVAFRVYRNEEIYAGSGKYRMKDVLYYHDSASWLSLAGFSLEIDPTESLTGVIIDYKFESE